MKTFAVAFMVAVIAMSACGCAIFGVKDPDRAAARGVLLTIAQAVHVADVACSQYGGATKDRELLQRCDDAYDVARKSLMAAESGIDTWDSVSRANIACSMVDGAASLKAIAVSLEAVQVKLPPIVDDVEKLVKQVEGLCVRGS